MILDPPQKLDSDESNILSGYIQDGINRYFKSLG